jgi:dynein heavy chain, axonemal
LESTKEISLVISERIKQSNITQESINIARESYREIAKRSSVLYFVIAELSEIDHMYRWSLEYFIQFFKRRLNMSKPSRDLKERVNILLNDITTNIY